jgi:hypothetical protein
MASTITAGNATNGLALSCDNTGILELKTGTGAGTTAMTIGTGQQVAVTLGSAAAPAITFAGDTNTGIFSPAADTIAFSEGGVESMRIDASGNLVVGTTSSLSSAANRIDITVNGTSSSMVSWGTGGTRRGYALHDATDFTIASETAGAVRFLNNGTERARIDSSGNLLVGQTSNAGGYRLAVSATWPQTPAGIICSRAAGQTAIDFVNSGTGVGRIDTTSTATSYITSSDYRLKENIAPMTGALSVVQQLKPCTYNWKVDGSDGQGFIAHELQEVVPECVTGEKDAVDDEGNIKPQGIDTSFLVATLTAAIQELKAELDATKAEVAALKGA